MSSTIANMAAATAAFDVVADHYDDLFTESVIGRVQRRFVWEALDRHFTAGQTVLEMNCGTGEDAVHLARRGVSIVACDASAHMVRVATRKMDEASLTAAFCVQPNETISAIGTQQLFDGAFSNFAGLNCTADLNSIVEQLALLLRPGSSLLLCVYAKLCLWEIVSYASRGHLRKAFRRFRKGETARLGGEKFSVYYPSIRQMQRSFSPWFDLETFEAIGLAVPPSYMEPWARRHPDLVRALVRFDERFRGLPFLRASGDHVLLTFRRRES